MVTSGIPYDKATKTEVIDLANNAKCEALPDFPYEAFAPTGGLVGQTPVICGGSRWNGGVPNDYDKCHTLTENGNFQETFSLEHVRSEYATVPFNSSTLWITGTDVTGKTQETEFFNLELGIFEGPLLPKRLSGHCMVKVNDDKFMMIAGIDFANDFVTREVYIYDAPTGAWSQAESLTNPRFDPICESFGNRYVVVAGGFVNRRNDLTISTEIYDFLDGTWTSGPDLPLEMEGFNMVTDPDNAGVVIFGGLYRYGLNVLGLVERFYRLTLTVNAWTEMSQELEVKRSYSVSMLIPDNLVTCA